MKKGGRRKPQKQKKPDEYDDVDDSIFEDNLERFEKSEKPATYLSLDDDKNQHDSDEDEPEEILGLDLPSEDEDEEEDGEEGEDEEDFDIPEKWRDDKYGDLRDNKLDGEDEEVHDLAWGKKKNIFYSRDVEDEEGAWDEEEAKEELEEALLLQKRQKELLRAEDFEALEDEEEEVVPMGQRAIKAARKAAKLAREEAKKKEQERREAKENEFRQKVEEQLRRKEGFESDEEDESEDESEEEEEEEEEQKPRKKDKKDKKEEEEEDEDEEDDGEAKKKAERKAKAQAEGQLLERFNKDLDSISLKETDFDMEKIKRDISALSAQEKLDIITSESPELLGLLEEYKAKMERLSTFVYPFWSKLKREKFPPSTGRELLEIEFHLLSNYCYNISFYLYLKAQGKKVKDHPVFKQLLKLKNCIDRLTPLTSQLDEKIDDMLSHVEGGEEEGSEDGYGDEMNGVDEDEDDYAEDVPATLKRKRESKKEEESSESELDETLFPRLEEVGTKQSKRRKVEQPAAAAGAEKLVSFNDFLDAVEEKDETKPKKNPIGRVVSNAVQHLNSRDTTLTADDDLLDRDIAGVKKQPERTQIVYDKKGRKKKKKPFELKEGKGRRTPRLGKKGRMRY